MLSRIMVLLGGYIAEKEVFDQITTGASDDLDKATNIAKAMVCRLGMSDLGPIVFGKNEDRSYMGLGMRHVPEYSEQTSERIDGEITKIMHECLRKATDMLTENRDKLDLLAKTLLEKETLQASEVYELLGIEPRETHSLRN